jgi:hypothetical protein
MKKQLMMAVSILTLFALAGTVQAAPVILTLDRTVGLYNDNPADAPLPLGRTQYSAGDVLGVTGEKIGEYTKVKNVHSGSLNVAAITITLYFLIGAPPYSVTLQGVHSFDMGMAIGSVTASGAGNLGSPRFTLDGGATGTLTIFLPD